MMEINGMRLIHGDCLEVMRGMDDNSVDLVPADPPYGMDFQSARRTESDRFDKIQNDGHPFIWWLYDAYRVTKDGGVLLCFCDWKNDIVWRMAIETAGYEIKSQIIWDRDIHGLGDLNGQFAPQHDLVYFATKGRFVFQNGRPKDVIKSQRITADKLVHPNEKPPLLLAELIRYTTNPGDTILDPFTGSGTTGVACVQTGRNFIGIEINKDYYDIACKRIAGAQPALF